MKKTQIDRAIEKLDAERRVLELAIETLKEQQAVPSTRKRRPKPVEVARPA